MILNVIIERTSTGFSAFVTELPGCIATGRTRDEVERDIRAAIAFHLDGMRELGDDVPDAGAYEVRVQLAA
ncbi:MAG: type II toxin-antitoxin system HicB family antitoxin [Gemmatimonadetes bacterium]|nr:type II toxin-antitoxin system HicB family antitoxin [Gemmatimonadota bacterium]